MLVAVRVCGVWPSGATVRSVETAVLLPEYQVLPAYVQ